MKIPYFPLLTAFWFAVRCPINDGRLDKLQGRVGQQNLSRTKCPLHEDTRTKRQSENIVIELLLDDHG